MRTAALSLLLACAAATVEAQGIEGKIGRFYESDGWTLYRLGMSRPLVGPLGTTLHGDYMRRAGDAEGAFAGLGVDVTAFQGGGNGPYLVAGLGGGMGSPHSRSFSSLWTSWSAGAGYELVPASFLRFGVEGRWREISLDRRSGFEVAAGLSFNLVGGPRRSAPETGRMPASRPVDSGSATGESQPATSTPSATPRTATRAARLADSVIATATAVMGRPYEYGGTGSDGGGFDCSGLIQYAYARHGITLPRRSTDQAREGAPVKASLAALAPGDLLTFSNRGGPVTHVGLYIGAGRFIHSASHGVQVSTLSGDDPYGRWWYVRWVGARRLVQ
ncbi:MAG TPA: C40 family peptidase [Gemmatimonadales bacterium]|nr:C40 family peptidase [Gemmatimonadales bacterium]